MASNSIVLEIVTPKGVVFSEKVEEVVAPSVHGEFGVLPGHLPMVTTLNIGLLHYKQGGESNDVAVGTGFAEVLHDKTLILTDRFMAKGEVMDGGQVLTIREQLKEVDHKLETWTGDLDDQARSRLIEEEQWLATQLELYGDPAVAKVLEKSRSNDISLIIPDLEEAGDDGSE